MPEFGPSAQDADDKGAATSRLLNCYRSRAAYSGRTNYTLKAVPGSATFAETGVGAFYAAAEHLADMYVAQGGKLFRVNYGGGVFDLGSITAGNASISGNNAYVTVASQGGYYTLLGNTLTQRTVNPFTSTGSVTYGDQYTVVTEKDGRRFAWSDIADPTTMPALNFATAEGSDDDLLRGIWLNGRLVLFKETSREVWANTGQSGANAFLRFPGGVRNIGLRDYNLVAQGSDVLFWAGNDGVCHLTANGLDAQPLSYGPVDSAISDDTATHCYYYEADGSKFFVVRFSDRPAWCYDIGMGEWHERSEGVDHGPWGAMGAVKLGGFWHTPRNDGKIYRLSQNNTDVGSALVRTAVTPTYYFRERRAFPMLRIFAETGAQDLGRDAQMWVRVSRDGGDTWSPEKWRSLGDIGDHGKFATWRRLGQARQMTIEANISEPAEMPLHSMFDLP